MAFNREYIAEKIQQMEREFPAVGGERTVELRSGGGYTGPDADIRHGRDLHAWGVEAASRTLLGRWSMETPWVLHWATRREAPKSLEELVGGATDHLVRSLVRDHKLAESVRHTDLDPLVADVEYLVSRLRRTFSERQLRIWLESFNPSLGTRPIDLVASRRISDVIAAIEREEAGSY